MIKIENIEVMGFKPAIRGMRNPMNSWNKSDSWFESEYNDDYGETTQVNILGETQVVDGCSDDIIGENDYNLMLNLAEAGGPHAKYRRMIAVYMDITAPLYWWKNSTLIRLVQLPTPATMHKIQEKKFELDDFSHEHLFGFNNPSSYRPDKDCVPIENEEEGVERFWASGDFLEHIILALNFYRNKFLETKDKHYWWQMIQLLPSSYNQKRTVMLNYEVLAHIYHDRKDHKLDEWREFCQTICAELPEPELFIVEE